METYLLVEGVARRPPAGHDGVRQMLCCLFLLLLLLPHQECLTDELCAKVTMVDDDVCDAGGQLVSEQLRSKCFDILPSCHLA
jgi:hypothetical protein